MSHKAGGAWVEVNHRHFGYRAIISDCIDSQWSARRELSRGMEDGDIEELDLVIAGGGICGLATALALHRKGIGSVVLERSETLRASGAGIAILTNGWRALDVLGVGSKLRPSAIALQRGRDINLVNGKEQQGPISMGEARNVPRSDLVQVLADDLPPGTIRFGCEILSINWDTLTFLPVIQLTNGRSIRAKVLIGCDGANSVVADFLGTKPKKILSSVAVRGFTHYPDGHGLAPELVRMRKGNVLSGRAPVNNKLVFWFVLSKFPQDTEVSRDPELIRQFAIESVRGFPDERVELIRDCDLSSLSHTHLRYLPPWHILLGKFRKGPVTVAGDAMHLMSPFIGQGGSAAIEDSIILARCLSRTLDKGVLAGDIGEALEQYVKERRMRLMWLSSQTYLTSLLVESSSILVKILAVALFLTLFRNPAYHTAYDIGEL